MADLKTFLATLPPRAIIRATGNAEFWKAFKTIAGAEVRWRKVLPSEDFSIHSFVERVQHEASIRPIIVIGNIRKRRPAFNYEPHDVADVEIVADFEDCASVVKWRDHRPGHTTLRIVGGKIIQAETR